MKRTIGVWVLFVLLFLTGNVPLWAKTRPPQENSMLPAFQLPIPADTAQRQYLGLRGKGLFTIDQIKAKAVIIEIFSMYCPYCQKEAPTVNNLYHRIEADPGLKGSIKIIGIGVGNSPFEVNIFKEKYQVPFPLFSDNNFTIHKCLGETRTPYFFVVSIGPGNTLRVIYSRVGGISDPDSFLKTIRRKAGIK
jgi:peroxiredoxin